MANTRIKSTHTHTSCTRVIYLPTHAPIYVRKGFYCTASSKRPMSKPFFFFTPQLRFYNIIYCTRAFSQRRCRPNRYAACNHYIIYFYYNIWRVTMRYNSYNRAAVDIIIYLRVFVYDADARVVRALYYT